MTLRLNGLRGFFAVLILLFGAAAVAAQEVETPWQDTVTAQVEAFRAADAEGAFVYASAPFHEMFASAEVFFLTFVSSGYAPIMDSRSHTFGSFTVLADQSVQQEVNFVGNDQTLHGAIYQLREEAEGWRVMGVQLMKQPGMGI
jgi:hypothetical protein